MQIQTIGNIHPKVLSATVAGALVVVFVWVLNAFFGVDVPAEVATALVVLLSSGVGYATDSTPLPPKP